MSGTARKNKVGSDGDEDGSRLAAQALQFVRYCRRWAAPRRDWPILRSVTLYPPSASRNGNWLVVGKGFMPDQKVVAFHRSPDPLTALVGFMAKGAAGTLVWKEDKYEPPID